MFCAVDTRLRYGHAVYGHPELIRAARREVTLDEISGGHLLRPTARRAHAATAGARENRHSVRSARSRPRLIAVQVERQEAVNGVTIQRRSDSPPVGATAQFSARARTSAGSRRASSSCAKGR